MSDAEASGCRDDAWWAGVLWARPPALLVLCGQPVPGLAALALQGGPPGLLFCCHCAQQPSGSAAAPASAAAHPVPASHLWSRAHFGLCVPRLTGSEPLTILPLTLEPEAVAQAHYKACDRLKLERKQRRMCRRDPGVAETLVEAVSMSALECQYQFRFERWNCTLEGRYRASLLKRGECAGTLDGSQEAGPPAPGGPVRHSSKFQVAGRWVGLEPAAPPLLLPSPPRLVPLTPAWNSCWWHKVRVDRCDRAQGSSDGSCHMAGTEAQCLHAGPGV